MSPLWMSIEPCRTETRLMLTQAPAGTALRARLPVLPAQPCALTLVLRGLSAWYGQPLCAALDADAEDVARHPERWAQLVGERDGETVRVEWVARARPMAGRDRFLGAAGDFRSARRLLTLAATGQR
jgi:hypothetical protein